MNGNAEHHSRRIGVVPDRMRNGAFDQQRFIRSDGLRSGRGLHTCPAADHDEQVVVRMGVHLRWPSTARFEVSDRPVDNFAERMFRAVSGKELFCQKTGVAGRGPESVHRPYGYS